MGERVLCVAEAEAVELAHESAKIWLNVALCQLRLKQNEACVESAARALDAAAPLLRVAASAGRKSAGTSAAHTDSASAGADPSAPDAPNSAPSPSGAASVLEREPTSDREPAAHCGTVNSSAALGTQSGDAQSNSSPARAAARGQSPNSSATSLEDRSSCPPMQPLLSVSDTENAVAAAANTNRVPDAELRARARHIETKANYLSARAATYAKDYERARDFIRKALALEPRNEDIINAAVDLEKYASGLRVRTYS